MKRKEYKSVVYGLQYKEYVKILNQKIKEAKGCKGYDDFREDIKILKKAKKDNGLPAFLADTWMKRICDMKKDKLKKFVNNYKKGDFNPYQFEPEYPNFQND